MLKDRKKANRKKFTTTDEIAKKLEETGKKVEKPKKEKPPPISQVPGEGEEEQVHQVEEIHEEDEWREFEEEKKDYTGLKIGHLQINEGENNIGLGDDEEDQMEENEAGEMVMRRKVQSGPWKMVNPQSQAPATEVQEPQDHTTLRALSLADGKLNNCRSNTAATACQGHLAVALGLEGVTDLY
uniref:Uncharacterized protein n=1 Tax=Timema douglasi TaxID=61478 RepID=A0A7R8ZFK5_TIMDO|nr:unnamed protein product [Timema douglasi]